MVTLNPKFKLKSPSSEEETLILLKVYVNYKRLTYSINRKVHPNNWNPKNGTGRVIVGTGNTKLKDRLREINTRINEVESAVISLSNHYNYNKIAPTPERLRKDLDEKLEKETKTRDKHETLNEYIERFINEIERGDRLTDKGQVYKKGTIKNYRGFQTQLNEYQEKNRKKLDFEDITIDFYDDFVRFFNGKAYSINTIGRHIKNLKTIMRAARDKKLHANNEIERNKFRVLKADSEQIYLNEEELLLLYKKDLSDKPHLELARDVFLIGCFTALRFSDYSMISKENLTTTADGNKVLKIITQKTGEVVIIPFWHWILEELLLKYDYTIPRKIYEQKLNKRIKDVGKVAGLDDPIEIEKIIGGKKVKTTIPKHQLIMTHTARRSGATLMHKYGFPTIYIMKITGHKLESNFMKYIKISKEETADDIIKKFKVPKPLKAVKYPTPFCYELTSGYLNTQIPS